jgi:hypothetical protein
MSQQAHLHIAAKNKEAAKDGGTALSLNELIEMLHSP